MALAKAVLKQGRGVNGSAYFIGGMASASDSAFIDDRSYRASQNTLHRGGVIRTRPSYKQLVSLPSGNLQGFFYFRPVGSDGHYVAIVDGKAYETDLLPNSLGVIPYRQLVNIQLYPYAKEVYATVATQAATRNSDGTITATTPQRVLFITDGAYTKTAYWDGNTNGHVNPLVTTTESVDSGAFVVGTAYTISSVGTTDFVSIGASSNTVGVMFTATGAGSGTGVATAAPVEARIGTPLGGPVEFSGDRLWIARENLLFAGDISNPFSFEENQYAAEGGYFQFPENIVALRELPSIDNPFLVVFCVNSTWVVRSNIRDRAVWKTTDNFQQQLLPGVGCVSSRSVINSFGIIWWMTPTGLVNFDTAQQARISSRLIPQDTEMSLSKANVSPDISLSCCGAYENFILCSVPNGDKYNRHTWVLDQAVVADKGGASWAGYWTGTRPVAWASGLFNNVVRCAHASKDYDGSNRIWEAFRSEPEDTGSTTIPITSFVETKAHIDFSEAATGLDRTRFVFAEVSIDHLLGDTNLKVYWAGTRGRYKLLGEWDLTATQGSLNAAERTNDLRTYDAQQRVIRTPAIQQTEDPNTCTSRGVESKNNDWIDFGFSLLIVWTGQAALRSYRIFVDPFEEPSTGDPEYIEYPNRVLEASHCE